MIVVNEHTKHRIHITAHGVERWLERFGSNGGDLAESLRVAIPFGGQIGDSIMLANGDQCFAISGKKPNGSRMLITCLTKSQAISNMQMRGIQFSEPMQDSVAPKLTKAEKKARKAQIAAENGNAQNAMRAHADMMSKDRDAIKRSLAHHIQDDALIVKIIDFANVLREKDRSTWPPKRTIVGFATNPKPEQ